jgi:hypothetical protein
MSSMIERQLVELERRYWQALKDKDVEAAIDLTDDPCIVAGAQGVGSIDHATYMAMMGKTRRGRSSTSRSATTSRCGS